MPIAPVLNINNSNYQFAFALMEFLVAFHAGKLKYPEDVAVELDKLAALAWSDVRSLPLPVVLPAAEVEDTPNKNAIALSTSKKRDRR